MTQPKWLTDSDERPNKLRYLAKKGVSRGVIRTITGWSNNQMAGFGNRAGIVFSKHRTVASEKMKEALLDVGFEAEDIECALSTAETPSPRKAATKRNSPRKKKKSKRKDKKKRSSTRASRPPTEPAVDVLAPLQLVLTEIKEEPEASLPSSDTSGASAPPKVDEVSAITESAIRAAADDADEVQAAQQPVRKLVPLPVRSSPRRFIAEVINPEECRAPVTGKSLGSTTLCSAKPVVSHGCCATHAKLLFGWRPPEE